MAWIFSLSIECGARQQDARAMGSHFAALALDGQGPLDVSVNADGDGGWWAVVSAGDVAAPDRGDVAARLYELLMGASCPYRYALVGLEVDHFRTYQELLDATPEELRDFEGLVLSDALWRALGQPEGFEAFRPGYLRR